MLISPEFSYEPVEKTMEEKQIAKNIKKIRVNRKRSVERSAKLSSLTKGYVSKIGNSDKAPPFSTLIKIAHALNAGVNLLIAEDSEVSEDINLFVPEGSLPRYEMKAQLAKKLWESR